MSGRWRHLEEINVTNNTGSDFCRQYVKTENDVKQLEKYRKNQMFGLRSFTSTRGNGVVPACVSTFFW